MNQAVAIDAPLLNDPALAFLPPDWPHARLGDLFEIQQGKALNAKNQTNGTRLPFLRTANVFWGRLDLDDVDAMAFMLEDERRLALKSGDLLTCEGGDVGRTAIWRGEIEPCYYQNHIHRLRMNREDVEPEFFMRWMEAAIRLLGLYGGTSNKTTIPNLSKNRLASFTVPHPSLREQRAIAAALRTAQNAIEACERVIVAARQLKAGLLHHLLTYGDVPVDRADQVPLKETDAGRVPEAWSAKPLIEVATLQRGRDLPADRRTAGDVPVVGSHGIVGYHGEAVAPGPGVLVGRSGSVGEVFLIESPYWPLNTALWVKEFHGNDPRFVYYLLQRVDFARYAAGVSVPTLNRNLVHPIRVAVPALHEQRVIAAQLASVDSRILAQEKRCASLRAIFHSLLRSLLTGAMRLPDFTNVS